MSSIKNIICEVFHKLPNLGSMETRKTLKNLNIESRVPCLLAAKFLLCQNLALLFNFSWFSYFAKHYLSNTFPYLSQIADRYTTWSDEITCEKFSYSKISMYAFKMRDQLAKIDKIRAEILIETMRWA